jgi:hypothetical protein
MYQYYILLRSIIAECFSNREMRIIICYTLDTQIVFPHLLV